MMSKVPKWVLAVALAVMAAACTGSAADECPTEGEALETAKLYIEHNATDADTGYMASSVARPGPSCASGSPTGS